MISFIIPTYNEEKRIVTILHCLSQYRGSREIIISDDNSTDATVRVSGPHADTIVMNPGKGHGIAATRNRGARIAKGDYFVFVDADMYIEKADAFFKKAENIFSKNPRIVGLTAFIQTRSDLETRGDRIMMGFFNRLFLVLNNILHFGASSGEFQMMRAAAFKKINGFNERIVAGEDHDLFRRLARIGRTHSEKTLTVFNDGRRARALGWSKLLWLWTVDSVSAFFFKKSLSKEWKKVR